MAEELGSVEYRVAVALFGEKELAVRREILIRRFARHHAVEVGQHAVGLGTQDPSQALGLLLTAAEGTRDLDRHIGVRQVDGEVGHLGDYQQPQGLMVPYSVPGWSNDPGDLVV